MRLLPSAAARGEIAGFAREQIAMTLRKSPPRPRKAAKQRSAATNADILAMLKSINRNLDRIGDKLDLLLAEQECSTDAAAATAHILEGQNARNDRAAFPGRPARPGRVG